MIGGLELDGIITILTVVGGGVAAYLALSMRARGQHDESQGRLIATLQSQLEQERAVRQRETDRLASDLESLRKEWDRARDEWESERDGWWSWVMGVVARDRQMTAELERLGSQSVWPPLEVPPMRRGS